MMGKGLSSASTTGDSVNNQDFNQPNTKMELADQPKLNASEVHSQVLKTINTKSSVT